MASTTPNIGLTLPTGAEKVSRQVINANNTIIDSKIGAVPGGQNLQGEIDALNSKIQSIEKIYRINVKEESVSSNGYFNLQSSYIADSFVSISNNNEIHFSESANVLILLTVIGQPAGGIRGWIELQGGNTNEDAISYGAYVTLAISAVYAVDTSTVLKIKNLNSDAFTVGGGGIAGSRIKIIRL